MKKYIVIEGIHGSGKSSVAKGLTKKLQNNGINAKYIHFPNEEEKLGQLIRSYLSDKELYKHREVMGLLYASASNIFHIKSKNDDYTYILERDSVTTGLVFQKEIPRETRLQIYKFGIENLKNNGQVVYVKTDKEIAFQRAKKRNEKLAKNNNQIRKDKANDQFHTKFEELSDAYDQNLIPQMNKLGLSSFIATNNGKLEDTIDYIFSKIL